MSLALLLLACTAKVDDSGDRRATLQALAELTLAEYRAFEERTERLSIEASAMEGAADEDALAATQGAWWSAREPWQRAEVVHFGPVEEYPLRLGPKLDDQPVLEDAVEASIAATEPPDLAAFEAMGSATRGLPVAEYLLWREGPSGEALLEAPARLAYLSGASADVHANAQRLTESWEQEWMPLLIDPIEGGPWESPQEVISEWTNRMIFTVENIRAEKLGGPLGDGDGGDPHPELLESWYSARSILDARDALDGVYAVWSIEGGVRSLLSEEDAALGEQVEGLFVTSAQRLAELPEPLETTLVVEPEVVVRAQEALFALQVALQVELAPALGVTVEFNDNDGD